MTALAAAKRNEQILNAPSPGPELGARILFRLRRAFARNPARGLNARLARDAGLRVGSLRAERIWSDADLRRRLPL